MNLESQAKTHQSKETKAEQKSPAGWEGLAVGQHKGVLCADCLGVLHAPNSHPLLSALTVEGNSDELDEPIKAVFADVAFVKKHHLMSLNSVNWSRVLIQMAHHFFAYFRCVPSLDMHPLPPVEVVVPTGAAGNLAGKKTPGWKWAFQENICGPSPFSCPLPATVKRKIQS